MLETAGQALGSGYLWVLEHLLAVSISCFPFWSISFRGGNPTTVWAWLLAAVLYSGSGVRLVSDPGTEFPQGADV